MSELTDLEGYYDSYEVDLASRFYIPLFKSASRVDRVSCYFSSKALALYGQGLQAFAKTPNSSYRLIISEEISSEDFEAMKRGELSFESQDAVLISRLRESLSIDQKDSIGTLVDLMSAGIVQIKIAFVHKGLFHSKWAYVENGAGEQMLMLGSNNETAAAIEENYEEFDFRPYRLTDHHKEKFEKMWNDQRPGFIVKNPSELVWSELKRHSKSRVRIPKDLESVKDCIFLDLIDEKIVLENRLENPPNNYNIVFRSRIKPYVKSYDTNIVFKDNLSYVDFRKIIKNLSEYCESSNILLYISSRLNDYINSHDLIIEKRRGLGLDIKNHRDNVMVQFEYYAATVNSLMCRKLYEKQMWDSFFMYSMKKAGNFSVPGSGKTASVLGVYAFLRHEENIQRLIVICPLNSFDSWINEYKECFGHDPDTFDARDYSGTDAITTFYRSYASVDLILINYDSLYKYSEVLDKNAIPNSLLVFDEGHYIKNLDAQRTSAARIVSENSTRTLILTGTPMPNSYADLYSLLNILFPKEYRAFFRYDLNTLKSPSDAVIADINNKIKPFYVRTSKDDLHIPAPNEDLRIHCSSTPDEIALYGRIRDACIDNPLPLIIRILQAESDPNMLLSDEIPEDVIQNFNEVPMGESTTLDSEMPRRTLIPSLSGLESQIAKIKITSKTKKCLDIVSELVNNNKTVIIWCIFKKSITNLHTMLDERNISNRIIDGSVKIKDRSGIIDDFKNGQFKVLITNPHTLAESVSLHQVCHDTVYFEYSYNLVHLLQSKDRIHRLGLTEGQYTQHRFLMADIMDGGPSDSLDEQIYQRLSYKEDLMKNAIESGTLETATSSSEEDIQEIFSKMGWKLNI